ncbi:hypothetical protein ACE6H2_007382 [Prunus campanulata]
MDQKLQSGMGRRTGTLISTILSSASWDEMKSFSESLKQLQCLDEQRSWAILFLNSPV